MLTDHLDDSSGSKQIVLSYASDQIRSFHFLEKWLRFPIELADQPVFQLTDVCRTLLLEKYVIGPYRILSARHPSFTVGLLTVLRSLNRQPPRNCCPVRILIVISTKWLITIDQNVINWPNCFIFKAVYRLHTKIFCISWRIWTYLMIFRELTGIAFVSIHRISTFEALQKNATRKVVNL